MRYKKLNKKNITQLLIEIQDRGDLTANAIATRAVKEYGLQPEHQKQTGNPESAYKQPTAGDDQRLAQPVDYTAPPTERRMCVGCGKRVSQRYWAGCSRPNCGQWLVHGNKVDAAGQ